MVALNITLIKGTNKDMIEIDYSRDELLDPYAIGILKDRYMLENETSPQQAFARAAKAFCGGDYELAQRIYDHASQLHFMFATPVLSNAPSSNGTARGLPISCFLNYVEDSREGINSNWCENTWLASMGGGIGSYWGAVRSDGSATSKGSKSTGSIPFMHVVDSQMLAVSQGPTRRGSCAVYTDISHPEIEEFIEMRKPTGGDIHRRNLNLHHGVNITDDFMKVLEETWGNAEADDSWNLIDPNSKEVVKVVSAKELWKKILTQRYESGEPYMHFIDTTNRLQPEAHKVLGLKVHQSNLCSEITLPTGRDYQGNMRTAVCCLSSVNLEKYDEWKDTELVEDLVVFLDNVLEYFIENAPEGMKDAVYSATQERSIGIGAMGFHAYLQSKSIPFDSSIAVGQTNQIFKTIRERAERATVELGDERGSCPDSRKANSIRMYKSIEEHGEPIDRVRRRNMHLLSVAPNASSSILCGNTSPSIEPYNANGYSQQTLNGTNIHKNRHLDIILRDKLGYTDEYTKVWKSIFDNKGSVQHLSEDVLTSSEKEVYKTANEIDQSWIIEHAGIRQNHIDQSQSVNLFFPSDCDKKYLHHVHFKAWKDGLKTLYYCRTQAGRRAENINIKVEKTNYNTNEECLSCEG